MRRRRLRGLFLPHILTLVSLAVLALGGLSLRALHRSARDQAFVGLEARARLFAALVGDRLAAGPLDEDAIDALCKELGRATGTRLTVVLPGGGVLGDAARDPVLMDNHASRPEIAAALAGRVGRSVRSSPTQQAKLMYVAVPLPLPDGGRAAARAALPLAVVDAPARAVLLEAALLWLLLSAGAAAWGLGLARRLGRRLGALREGVGRLAAGELQARLPAPGVAELDALAGGINEMAAALDERLRAGQRRLSEQEAVLRSMLEGVLAVDNDERLLRLNAAAARLLRVEAAQVEGRPIQEIVRNVELQRFIARVLASREPQEGEIILRDDPRGDGERYMQAHGTVLRDEQGRGFGALVVLNDLTRLRRLETVRREFVANVSHELKTPITSIKGFVETLLDGALRDPQDARRFLEIVAKQADRLNAIIEDLLALSSLEQAEKDEKAALARGELRPVLQSAAQVCEAVARDKGLEIRLDCPTDLAARMNAPLLEQAVVNLIDNAVKYSDPGGAVEIAAATTGGGVEIRVRDHGCGIAAEHLPRLFERFYRVDRGRSRQQGGTGLGLAIVKHIVLAHGGAIEVASEVGSGSVFTIRLP